MIDRLRSLSDRQGIRCRRTDNCAAGVNAREPTMHAFGDGAVATAYL
jgi:hypothetical protein